MLASIVFYCDITATRVTTFVDSQCDKSMHANIILLYLHSECIYYSAQLRLPASLTKEEKMRRVDAVITELNLQKCANTPIGNQFVRGVSGGERKRTAIGKQEGGREKGSHGYTRGIHRPFFFVFKFGSSCDICYLFTGVELVTDPSVLFLDEPTTGLDSHTALGMVHTLKALARTGRTIVSPKHTDNARTHACLTAWTYMKTGLILHTALGMMIMR